MQSKLCAPRRRTSHGDAEARRLMGRAAYDLSPFFSVTPCLRERQSGTSKKPQRARRHARDGDVPNPGEAARRLSPSSPWLREKKRGRQRGSKPLPTSRGAGERRRTDSGEKVYTTVCRGGFGSTPLPIGPPDRHLATKTDAPPLERLFLHLFDEPQHVLERGAAFVDDEVAVLF